ncbi:peptide methionine sulfoxide reductase msrB/msrA [Nannizzia gypsea CBS 118893]|uniref:peptide-methionine (S)-S-oxide reductase n=1 Tax=Arthroderma gypseum (strain ATCC MYA-4604 / CBS 118893) TaxID=535722 RepID=E4V0C3_ARTGP|nr:peptide methionine sulfoxide reductase msrB/msrA [Nannizzia gypsea CBS 118893]EFR03060.1 peptide methionine sulfoxide reductase msrB/msrA [Nannizzia gypsea CBS 118893]
MTVLPESLVGGLAAKQQGIPPHAQKATFAAGCFWGVEHIYRRRFGNGKGLLDASVGYCGGKSKLPTYHQVCTGQTGHAEAIEVIYDPTIVSYQQLVEFFYSMHDPTTKDRQGGDTGTQYRSAVFAHNDEQLKIAKGITDQVARRWWKAPITTELNPPDQWQWWTAEKYHQLYLEKNPTGYVCPAQ